MNTYTNIVAPGAHDVIGAANVNSTVTMNGQSTYRRGEYFHAVVTTNNASSAHWQPVNVAISGGASVSGNLYTPKQTSIIYHDADGNLTNDGRWAYFWDGENRLIGMATLAGAPAGSQRAVTNRYDYLGRRIQRTTWTNNVVMDDRRFVYDGLNLIAELHPTSATVYRSYCWGADLSGTIQGAGGVGGLILVNDSANGAHFAMSDANGNVTGLVNATSGVESVRNEYGPFGESIRRTSTAGDSLAICSIGFSSKVTDPETGLSYYGYRFYDSRVGRWLNRDPVGEASGLNLFGFVSNQALNLVDFLGLAHGNPIPSSAIAGLPGGMRVRYPGLPQPPVGPSWRDHLGSGLGGISSSEVDNKQWFEQNYPGWVSNSQAQFAAEIEAAIQRECGKRRADRPGDQPVSPFFGNQGTHLTSNPRAPDASANETQFGDKPQSKHSADKVLGSFGFQIEAQPQVSYSAAGGCCYRYTWTASMIVSDGLGLEPHDGLSYKLFGPLFPDRPVTRARWTIGGSGECCQ